MNEFKSKINGMPCIIRVLSYYAGTNYRITSASLEPNDAEEFEFEVLHYKTEKPNNWLAGQLTEDDEARIMEEYLEGTEEIY